MEKIAVFLNDADRARELLEPLRGTAPTHWLLAACPPVLTRHAGRWVTKAAHAAWNERWSAELFAQVAPLLREPAGSRVETLIVKRGVRAVAERLVLQHGPIRVLDARRPRWGQADESLSETPAQSASVLQRWSAPVLATAGLSSLLLLAD